MISLQSAVNINDSNAIILSFRWYTDEFLEIHLDVHYQTASVFRTIYFI